MQVGQVMKKETNISERKRDIEDIYIIIMGTLIKDQRAFQLQSNPQTKSTLNIRTTIVNR